MPPSPPASGNEDLLQHGLHHIVLHNSTASFPKQDHYDEAIVLSNYGSPAPDERYGYQGQPSKYQYQHQQQDSGIGIQYDGFPQDYRRPMYSDYNTPATSPPTPAMMSQEIRTRSGMTFPRQNLRPMPDNHSRDTKSPKPKKAKKEKVKAEKKVAKLDKPLSELTKDWTHVPVVDIEAYVNRSAEERRREVEEGKIPGKVKRPMNSFMLYRKAYQNRTKDWCLQNNHQVVSQVCGDSWPLEPEEVRKQFEDWSRIERINHQNAHPGYKFSPSKPGTVNKKRKPESEPPVSDESDLDDFEWRDPSFKRSKKTRYQQTAPRVDQSPVVYPSQRSAYLYSTSRENSMEPGHAGALRSSYQANNPGRPLPAQYSQSNLGEGEYYQTSILSNSSFPGGTQDVVMRKAATPSLHPGSYLGLPGAAIQEYETMHSYQYEQCQADHRIDPSLMPHAYDNGSFSGETIHGDIFFEDQSGGHHWQPQYSSNEHDPTMPFVDPELHAEEPRIHHPHAHVLKGHQEGWQAESMDAGGEFDKWMPENERGKSPP